MKAKLYWKVNGERTFISEHATIREAEKAFEDHIKSQNKYDAPYYIVRWIGNLMKVDYGKHNAFYEIEVVNDYTSQL